jgi:hypothetical protein
MLFVPSVDGITHNPKEFSTKEHLARGAQVLLNDQCWPAIYREGCGGLGRATDQSAQELYWSLVFGFCDRDDYESCGCRTCALHTQANAEKACLLDQPLTVCRAVSVV